MADSQYGDLALESRRFEPRVGEPVEAEWGTLTVPENRRRPDSSPITLAFVRFPARTADPGRPIVFLAGGPGESGIEVAGGSHFPIFMALRDPLTRDTTNVAVGRFDIEYVTAAGIADTRVIALMPAWFDGMSRGDFSLPAKKPLLARYLFLLKRGLGGNAMSLLMDCASGATRERWERIEREAAQTVLGRTIDFPFPEIGEAWEGPDLGDGYRAPVSADNTVLFLSASFDCRAPLDNILEIRKGLPSSDHIVVEDAGHMDVFLSCPGVADTMRAFFRGETVDTRPRFAEPRFAFVAPDSS